MSAMGTRTALIALVVLGSANSENSTLAGDDTCAAGGAGPFSLLLEEWATSEPAPHRQGRVMALPPTMGYYVTERIDGPLVPPPPPHGSGRPIPLHPSSPYNSGPPQGYSGPHGYNEWDSPPPPANSKIVNKPPKPYKDKFRPSYPPPQPAAPPARPPQPSQQTQPSAVDRVDEPPRKQVTETDLYLLGAIEKLVYRADLMEKRLRKLEDALHHMVVGADRQPEPCVTNYTRVGAGCYQWSSEPADWKGASVACRKQRAALLELQDGALQGQLLSKILADSQLKGKDFWTGGLNPGLLWIWSHSAKPVEVGAGNNSSIAGEGRCLALAHDPARAAYALRGRDCALRLRYICQKEEDKTRLSNEIERAARGLPGPPLAARGAPGPEGARSSKLLWED